MENKNLMDINKINEWLTKNRFFHDIDGDFVALLLPLDIPLSEDNNGYTCSDDIILELSTDYGVIKDLVVDIDGNPDMQELDNYRADFLELCVPYIHSINFAGEIVRFIAIRCVTDSTLNEVISHVDCYMTFPEISYLIRDDNVTQIKEVTSIAIVQVKPYEESYNLTNADGSKGVNVTIVNDHSLPEKADAVADIVHDEDLFKGENK